ncbi:hypothetical protein GH714_019676 [Hevea brasiliensis]|uniref:Chloride channel protein n=1 Tax=Hevea brasiliensis TaxID=3981 RepID=A0A6A6K6M3_HEVBR|nr:hypothetical protein GH714_019676 [Hevea brasiliensis]
MLSNHLQDGIETAKLMWSRIPSSEDGLFEGVGLLSTGDGSSVESLDYEVIENYAYREEQAQRGKLYVGYYVAVKWLFALLIGIGTGLAAVFINISVENFAGWKFSLTFSIIQKSYFAGFVVYVLINLVLVYSSVYIITQFAPAAAGSGIPEIKGYLNGLDIHGILLFRTLIGKVTCGCAAGVAAFRAPVGGVLFALEEVTSWQVIFILDHMVEESTYVASLLYFCYCGSCRAYCNGMVQEWKVWAFWLRWLCNMGHIRRSRGLLFCRVTSNGSHWVIGGLLGALFNQLTLYITRWRRNYLHKKSVRVKVVEACLISVITSVISFGLPLLRKCSPCPEVDADSGIECPRPPGMYGNYVNFYCDKNKEYNDLATIFFNTQDDAIRNLFSAKTIHEFSAQSLLTFLVMFYTLAVVTFGTAVPAGQFVPGIMIGSTYGRLVGMCVVKFYNKPNIEEGTYALLGAASFLGGSMRMTVSLCVIMVEITNNLKLLPLIMLVSLYQRLLVMLLTKVISFPRVAKVADVVSILRSNKHNGFPVIDHTRNGETLVIGLVLRSHLLVLLQSKVDFQHSPLPCDPSGGSRSIRHNFSEFVKPVSSKGISIEDIHLSSDDLEMYIDLAPFLNPSPYVVPEDMSLTKVYNLFRELGLRHIFVVPRASRVIGLITRKDLLIEDNEDSGSRELQSTSVREANMPAIAIASDGDVPEFEGKITFKVIICVMIAACGGLMFGYDVGVSDYHWNYPDEGLKATGDLPSGEALVVVVMVVCSLLVLMVMGPLVGYSKRDFPS